jgi:hypothetical protein
MFEVAIEKLRKNPLVNPVIRAWEVKRKGGHDYSIVYKVFDRLLKSRIVIAIEPEVDRNEVKFTSNGLQVLKEELDFWKRKADSNALERLRLETLLERLREFEQYFESET